MTYIPDKLREQVAERAEYCLLPQRDSLYTHEVDHIIPIKHRGETTIDNLCLACLDCNRNKGSDFASFDPHSGAIVPLYNPREDAWEAHFQLDGGRITPLSNIGRVTTFVLTPQIGLPSARH